MTARHPFPSPRRGPRLLAASVALLVGVASASAQTDATNPQRRRADGGGGEERRSFNPQEMQARMLTGLRDRMGVTSDEEWGVISERLQKVIEARRATGAGGPGAGGIPPRGGPPGGGGDGQRGPGGGFALRTMRPGGGSPESAALQSAVADKLPDAEIKARLNQLRLTRKANEAKLEAAQDELRAVLTVRQEAMAVLFGLLN
jgi:hypothetical protein